MSDRKPKVKHTVEIDETTYRQLLSMMAVLIRAFPKEAEKVVFNNLEKSGRKKVQTACDAW